jgi:SAM-dependent methyltransferase
MIQYIHALIEKCAQVDGETQQVMRFVFAAAKTHGSRVLDVGCGYGRFLRPMIAAGLQVAGVDVNPAIVSANRAAGLNCMTAKEFETSNDLYDVILMAHIIEHLTPRELVNFMDAYLDRLKPGGQLVIVTPLMSDYFYEDFDHIKPYLPTGILMVFGERAAQVQYYARNRMELRDIWFRRSPFRISHARGRYQRTPVRYCLLVLDLMSAAIFLLSGRLIGRADGWVGVFEKSGGK